MHEQYKKNVVLANVARYAYRWLEIVRKRKKEREYKKLFKPLR